MYDEEKNETIIHEAQDKPHVESQFDLSPEAERDRSEASSDSEDHGQHDKMTGLPLAKTRSRMSNIVTRVASRVSVRTDADPGPPPDGGTRAWLQCLCGWIAIMNTWGFVNSFGAFQTYYEDILPQTSSTISWIGSVQACLMFFLGTFSGRALDAGLLRPTIFIGICFQVVGVFTMSFATNYWQLLLTQGVLTGIGGGIFFCPIVGLMSTYFSKKRGMAIGLATSGNAVGGLVYPLIVRQLLPMVGFGWTVRTLGFLNIVTLGIIMILMRPRLPPRKAGPIVEWSSIKDTPYVLFVLGVCFLMASVYFAFYYIASFAQNIVGLSYTSSLNLVIVLNGVGIAARIIPGIIADRYLGVLNTIIPIIFLNIVLLFSWLAVASPHALYVWAACYGAAASAFQSLFPTAIASLGNDLSKSGVRLGMACSTVGIAALLGGPIGGAILSSSGGRYSAPIAWAGVNTAIGTALIVAARVKSKGWGLRTKC